MRSKIYAQLDIEECAGRINSFEFEGKRVRAGNRDYAALSEFSTRFTFGEESWDADTVWPQLPNFDAVPLPTIDIAKAFAAAMLDHKQDFLARKFIEIGRVSEMEATQELQAYYSDLIANATSKEL